MPVLSVQRINAHTLLGCWKVEESYDDLIMRYGHLTDVVSHYKSIHRRISKLCVYALLYQMTGDETLIITHNDDGKPFIEGWNISISDTQGYVAVMISRDERVGVDIEYMSNRVTKIAERFIRDDEEAESVGKQLVHWCAKEAVYKLFSEHHLGYFDMRLGAFPLGASGVFPVEIAKIGRSVEVAFRMNADYVLTFTSTGI